MRRNISSLLLRSSLAGILPLNPLQFHRVGIEEHSGKVRVKVDERYFRPTEVDVLLGDPTKARTKLKWDPTKTSFPTLVKEMVDADIINHKKIVGTSRDHE